MILIGLMGKKGVGKDTLADRLVSRGRFQKMAFADPLKAVCREMFALTSWQLHDPEGKETVDERWGMTPRQMMQRVGTDMVRSMLGKDFWLRRMDLELGSLMESKQMMIVISDVRFANEAQWVRDRGGMIVRVIAEHDKAARDVDAHASETEQEKVVCDMEIVNDKRLGLDSFYARIDRINWMDPRAEEENPY